MPNFSIIIPFENDVDAFHETVASALRHRPEQSQVILVHDGTYHDPHALGEEVEFVETTRRKNLIRLFNAGTQSANQEVIAFLRPGVELNSDWHLPVAESFANPKVGSVSPLIHSSRQPNRVVTTGIDAAFGCSRKLVGQNAGASARSTKFKPLGPSSWAAFYRKSLLEQIGSCDDLLDPVYLDLELAFIAQKLGFQCRYQPDCRIAISQPTWIQREANSPHGCSAERASRRHSREHSLGITLLAACSEIFKSPLNPSFLKHAWQRFNASRFADIDRHFAETLERKIRQQAWEDAHTTIPQKRAA